MDYKTLVVWPANDMPRLGYCTYVAEDKDSGEEFKTFDIPSPVATEELRLEELSKNLIGYKYVGGRIWEQVVE